MSSLNRNNGIRLLSHSSGVGVGVGVGVVGEVGVVIGVGVEFLSFTVEWRKEHIFRNERPAVQRGC